VKPPTWSGVAVVHAPLQRLGRRVRHRPCDPELPDEGKLRRGDFRVGPVREADRPFHVGLPGAEPDFANDHIVDRQGVFAGDHQRRRDAAGLHCVETHQPATVGGGRGGHLLATEAHRDPLPGRGLTPDRHRPAALEDQMVLEKGRQGDIGLQPARQQEQAQEQDAAHDGLDVARSRFRLNPIPKELLGCGFALAQRGAS
jgi:hypothetical protein